MQLNSLIDFLGRSFLSPGSPDEQDSAVRSRFSSVLTSSLSLLSSKRSSEEASGLGANVLGTEAEESPEATLSDPFFGRRDGHPTDMTIEASDAPPFLGGDVHPGLLGAAALKAGQGIDAENPGSPEGTLAANEEGAVNEHRAAAASTAALSHADSGTGHVGTSDAPATGALQPPAEDVPDATNDAVPAPQHETHPSRSNEAGEQTQASHSPADVFGVGSDELGPFHGRTSEPDLAVSSASSTMASHGGRAASGERSNTGVSIGPSGETERAHAGPSPTSTPATAADGESVPNAAGTLATAADGESIPNAAGAPAQAAGEATGTNQASTELFQTTPGTADGRWTQHATADSVDSVRPQGTTAEGVDSVWPQGTTAESVESVRPQPTTADGIDSIRLQRASSTLRHSGDGGAPESGRHATISAEMPESGVEASATDRASLRAAKLGRQAEHLTDRPFRLWREGSLNGTSLASEFSGLSKPESGTLPAQNGTLRQVLDGVVLDESVPGESAIISGRESRTDAQEQQAENGVRSGRGRMIETATGRLKHGARVVSGHTDQSPAAAGRSLSGERPVELSVGETAAGTTDLNSHQAESDGSEVDFRAHSVEDAEGRTAPRESSRNRGGDAPQSAERTGGQAASDGGAGGSSNSNGQAGQHTHGHPQETSPTQPDGGDFPVETLEEHERAAQAVDIEEGSDEPHFSPEKAPAGTPLNGVENTARPARAQSAGSLAWLRSILSHSLTSTSLEEGWKVIEMQLDDGQGTMTVKARRDDDGVSIAVTFTDPHLRSLAEANLSRLEELLAAEYESNVDLSLEGGGADESSDRSAAQERPEGPHPQSSTPTDEISSEERRRTARAAVSGARNEWVG